MGHSFVTTRYEDSIRVNEVRGLPTRYEASWIGGFGPDGLVLRPGFRRAMVAGAYLGTYVGTCLSRAAHHTQPGRQPQIPR